jgi:hypothetical protein
MRVAVQANLVTGVANHGAFFGEGFERVAGNEPRGFNFVLVEEFQETAGAQGAGEETWRMKPNVKRIERMT